MTSLLIATTAGLAAVSPAGGQWRASLVLPDMHIQCIAVDPLSPSRIYCGAFDNGVWVSTDGGKSWSPAGEGIPHRRVMSLAVSRVHRHSGLGRVWAGTEPSAVFSSTDGGKSWMESKTLQDIPSKPTWSFPPRPHTSHVRTIALHPFRSGTVYAGIELGGVMRSTDGGKTWEDRKERGQHDAHQLAVHPGMPDRVYEAAGGGYAESGDSGRSWSRQDDGLEHRYVWSVAVDAVDPEVRLISVSPGPRQAHDAPEARSAIYRREAGGEWRKVTDGLPPEKGTLAYNLCPHPEDGGAFYAVTSGGDGFVSQDGGLSWKPLQIQWPETLKGSRVHSVAALSQE